MARVTEDHGRLVARERLWLTADRKRVVGEGDPDAAVLLAGVGGEISADDAKRYGLRPVRSRSQRR